MAILLVLACTFHAAAILLGTMVPGDSRLRSVVDPVFRPWLILSGSLQTWSMFTSAPYYREFSAVLVAVDAEGQTREFGPALPGLRPYDAHTWRHHKLLGGLGMPTNRALLDAYLERAKAEIEARGGPRVRSLTLRFDTQRIYNVAHVRETRQLSFPESWQSETRVWRE